MIKIIIAEDEFIERESLRYLIQKYYFKKIEIIAETSNGKDTIQEALIKKPDIILLDIHMPQMDGLTAAAKIRSNNIDVEIIILTAYSYFEYAQRAISLKISDFLIKPYSDKSFCQAIDKSVKIVLQKRKQINQQQIIAEMGKIFESEFLIK